LHEINDKNSELEQHLSTLGTSRDALAAQITEAKKKNSSMSITLKSIQAAIAQLKKDEVSETVIAKESIQNLQQRRIQFDELFQKITADPGKY
jgi:Mg2+ and Co2+ transporter CorA